MNTKATRRKKSSLTEVKVAVIGAPGVGKSGKVILLKTKNKKNYKDNHIIVKHFGSITNYFFLSKLVVVCFIRYLYNDIKFVQTWICIL